MPTPINLNLSDTESSNWADQVGIRGARDSQDLTLALEQPVTAKARDSQDLSLEIQKPVSAKARDSQEIELSLNKPVSALARLSQDIVLFMYPTGSQGIGVSDSETANWADALLKLLLVANAQPRITIMS